MPVQHRSQITTAIARLNQSSYGDATAFGDDWRRIISDSQETGEWTPSFANDAGYDQGSDLAQDLWLLTHDAGISLTPDFCFQDMGFLLKDALGGYAVAQLDGGPYQHTFTPQDVNTSRQLPSRTIMKEYGGLGLYLFRDMVSSSFAMSGGKVERLKINAAYKGSGHAAIDPASYVMPGIVDDREYAYGGQVVAGIELATGGTAQVETATAAGTATTPGDATLTLTSANLPGSPIAVPATLAGTENATAQAIAFRAALRADKEINSRFIISGTGADIVLTDRIRAANDATLNLAIGAGSTGIDPVASSADTTAGIAATGQQNYACDLETWSLNLNNPAAEEGYRQCSDYLTLGDPESGAIRSEYLLGAREYMFDFTARLNSSDPLRGWMQSGTELRLRIPIFGIEANGHSLVVTHDRVRITNANEVPDVGGYIGINGQCTLMATSGVIGLSAVLINDVATYAS